MNTQQPMEERLWDYIDGMSMPEEKSAIELLIESNMEWKRKYHELLDIHQLMGSSLELDEPSMRFTQNVMEDISKYQIAPAAQSFINKRIIWGIAAFFILTITGFLVYSLGKMQWSGGISSNSINNHVVENYTSQINKIDFSRFFNNTSATIFLLINVILALFLLDMYLNTKKKQLRQSLKL
jgi:regulatory protein YycI of two-component signal transduction system YycFG